MKDLIFELTLFLLGICGLTTMCILAVYLLGLAAVTKPDNVGWMSFVFTVILSFLIQVLIHPYGKK